MTESSYYLPQGELCLVLEKWLYVALDWIYENDTYQLWKTTEIHRHLYLPFLWDNQTQP